MFSDISRSSLTGARSWSGGLQVFLPFFHPALFGALIKLVDGRGMKLGMCMMLRSQKHDVSHGWLAVKIQLDVGSWNSGDFIGKPLVLGLQVGPKGVNYVRQGYQMLSEPMGVSNRHRKSCMRFTCGSAHLKVNWWLLSCSIGVETVKPVVATTSTQKNERTLHRDCKDTAQHVWVRLPVIDLLPLISINC